MTFTPSIPVTLTQRLRAAPTGLSKARGRTSNSLRAVILSAGRKAAEVEGPAVVLLDASRTITAQGRLLHFPISTTGLYPILFVTQLIVIVTAFDGGPPGFTATTDAVPAAATSLAGMATVTCCASTIVVVR